MICMDNATKSSVQEALAALGLSPSRLIKDTTREQRIEIIERSLSWCGEGSRDNCGLVPPGVGRPLEDLRALHRRPQGNRRD